MDAIPQDHLRLEPSTNCFHFMWIVCRYIIDMPKKFDSVEDRRAYWNEWYERNKHRKDYKAKDQATKKRIRKERRVWFQDLKKTLKCNKCPESDWRTLDFHHKDPSEKDWEVANMVRSGWSQKTILEEMEKCEVLCSNCHRKEHWKEHYGDNGSESFNKEDLDRG